MEPNDKPNPEDMKPGFEFKKDGKKFRVLDTYSRYNPEPKNVGKEVWFTISGVRDIFIGKIVNIMPLGYTIDAKIANSPILRRLLINSQAVIVPE